MTTLTYEGVDYNVVYIDPSLSSAAGDGSTYATALNTFPASLADRTCYLMRRTEVEYKIDMPFSGNKGIRYIMFLGMPTSDSPFYSLIDDADVKAAWVDENIKYTNIRMNAETYNRDSSTSNVVFYETSIQSFISENCYYFRDNDSGTASDYLNPMFIFDNIQSGIKFIRCKFSYTDYELDNDDYLNNNTNINTNTSKYPQRKCAGYVYIGYANELIIDSCVINSVSNTGSSYSPSSVWQNSNYKDRGIWVYNYCKKFILVNSEINRYNYDTNQYGVICTTYNSSIYPSSLNEIIISNVKINCINGCSRVLHLGSAASMILKDITIKSKGFRNYSDGDSSSTVIYTGANLSDVSGTIMYYKMIVENIKADMANSPKPLSVAPLLSLRGHYQETPGNPNSYIKNIDFKFKETNGVYRSHTILSIYPTYQRFNSSNGYLSNSLQGMGTYKINMNENISIVAPYNTGWALYLDGTGVKTKKIVGRVYCYSSILDIDEIDNNIGNSVGISAKGDSYVRCKKYVHNTTNKSYLYNGGGCLDWDYGSATSVYIDESNVLLWSEQVSTSNATAASNTSYVCPNYIQTGQFFARNSWILAKSWNVTRTGSTASASIRFNHNSISGVPPLVIGNEPYKGFEVYPGTSGSKKITGYLAFKNFTDVEFPRAFKSIGIIARVPETDEEGKVSYHDVYCTSGLLPDNSTWSNETDLRTYKVEIPVEVTEVTEPILIKVIYDLYSPSGVTYIDPDFKIA